MKMMILQGPRDVVDIVVGSHGALRKLFHEGYLKTDRTSMLALDEIDTLLDDTFKVMVVNLEGVSLTLSCFRTRQ